MNGKGEFWRSFSVHFVKVGLGVVLLSVGLLFGLALRSWNSARNAEAGQLQNDLSVSPQAGFQAAIPASLGVQADSGQEGSASVQDPLYQRMNVTASNFQLAEAILTADVCYAIPDGEDWSVRGATLRFGDASITEYGWDQLSLVEKSGAADGRRCDRLSFEVPKGQTPKEVTLSIDLLLALPREGESCTSGYLNRAQSALNSMGVEATIDCENGIGIDGLQVTSTHGVTTLAQANSAIHSMDFLVALDGARGPWVFRETLP